MKDLIEKLFIKSQLNEESVTDAFRELFDDYKIQLVNTGYFLYSECDGILYNYDGITYRNLVGIYDDGADGGEFKRFSKFQFQIELGDSENIDLEDIDSLRNFYTQRIKVLDDINFCFKRLQNHTINVVVDEDDNTIIFSITSCRMDVNKDEYEFLLPMVEMYREINNDVSALYATKLAKVDKKLSYISRRDNDEYQYAHYHDGEVRYTNQR